MRFSKNNSKWMYVEDKHINLDHVVYFEFIKDKEIIIRLANNEEIIAYFDTEEDKNQAFCSLIEYLK